MPLFPQQFIEDLRLHANIVQIVQEHVSLKRAGTSYKGLCPFHSEKTPSFTVNPDKGFFHCFGCHARGDVFKFVMQQESLGFFEAVKLVAQKTGVSLPEMVEHQDADGRRDAALRETMLKLHELAAEYFRESLASPAGARARQQLAERQIAARTIEQLGLGFAPGAREGLKQRLLARGFAVPELLQSGLLSQRENGDIVDRFRNRLIVPICRDSGSVIAFGGRQMDPDQGGPKYLNSPETPIYSKSRTLYGLNLTKADIRSRRYAVLVEGYFDFAQVFQTEAAPVVASCGTALTPQQAQLLHRFTTKVVLSYDPDAAGQGAAERSCELLVAEGFEVNVVVLDKGEDPDTFIRRHGAERYRERLRSSRPYLEYLLDRASSGLDFAQDENRRQFLGKMLAVAARIPDVAARDQFADRIAHKARITEEVVRAEIRKAAVAKRTEVTSREMPGAGQLKASERGLIWGLFHRTAQALAALAELEATDFEYLSGRDIFEQALGLRDQPAELLPSELLRRLSTMNAQLVTGIASQATPPFVDDAGLTDCARSLKRMRWERERAAVQREIDRLQGLGTTAHGDEINVLLNQKRHLAQQIERLT
jgi:DNA primase